MYHVRIDILHYYTDCIHTANYMLTSFGSKNMLRIGNSIIFCIDKFAFHHNMKMLLYGAVCITLYDVDLYHIPLDY
jgi:hypothetical protein